MLLLLKRNFRSPYKNTDGFHILHDSMISSIAPYRQGTIEKFFVPGGFAVGHKDQEIAVTFSHYLCTAFK